MKIRFIHASNPRMEKVIDTEKSYRNCICFFRDAETGKVTKTQEQFDKEELRRFAEAVEKKQVISFSVIEESGGIENGDNRKMPAL